MNRNLDLTTGSVGKKLILFAIPLLLGSMVQQLYNTVDLIFAGNFINKSASAAIGASSMLVNCLVGFFGGMSVGSGVIISQFFGAKNTKKLSNAIHSTVTLCLLGGFFLMVAGFFFAPVYLNLINTPSNIYNMSLDYLRIYLLSFISIVSYNLCSGVLRALGDSRWPLYAQIIGGLTNVFADYLFLCVFKQGVIGVAFATFFSQTVAALIVVIRLSLLDSSYALRLRNLRIYKDIFKETLRIGIPAGTQALLITLSNIMAQYHINTLGEDAIAAFTSYYKIELLIYCPILALGQATMTFTAQNKGAENNNRIKAGTIQGLIISVVLSTVTSIICLLFGNELFGVFNKDSSIISLGCQIIKITFPFYFLYSFIQILGDSLRGMGNTKTPMLIVMINICVIRTALLFILVPMFKSVRFVAVVYPITWFLTALSMGIYYLYFQKKTGINRT